MKKKKSFSLLFHKIKHNIEKNRQVLILIYDHLVVDDREWEE